MILFFYKCGDGENYSLFLLFRSDYYALFVTILEFLTICTAYTLFYNMKKLKKS